MAGANDTSRFSALDGLRGWAALSVVISHCLLETFKVRFPEITNFGTAFVANGTFAVAVFLAISGYVLTIRRWHNPANPPLAVAVGRRYIRLTLPILGATLLTWLLMSLGQTPTRAAHDITQVHMWYGTFVRFEPGFLDAWSFALLGAYGFLADHNYNPFLWTMMIELWGALAVFAISQNDRYLRDPYMPLLFLTALMFFRFPIAACFFAGAFVALAERDGFVLKPSPLLDRAAMVLLTVCLTLAAIELMDDKNLQYLAVLGTGVFLGVRYSPTVHRFLNLPISQFLGQISFPLYLVQFAVIISFSAQAIVWVNAMGMLTVWTSVAIAVVSTVVCLVAATLFLPIEIGTLALLRRFDRYRAGRRPALSAVAVKA